MKKLTATAILALALNAPLTSCSTDSRNLDTPTALPKVSIDPQGAKWAPQPAQEFRNATCELTPTITTDQAPSEYALSIPGTTFYTPLETRPELTFPKAPAGIWWEGSAPIGSTGYGPAITAGHVDYGPGELSDQGGELSPWGTLHAIEPCTHLAATDQNGTTYEYVITDKFTVEQDHIATSGILNYQDPSDIALVTCSGKTLEAVGPDHQFNYEHNLVIKATLIPTTTA